MTRVAEIVARLQGRRRPIVMNAEPPGGRTAMMYVRTLGTAVIEIGGTRITPAAERKFALLLYLAALKGATAPRALLSELLFPDRSPSRAGHSFRQLVYEARRGGAPIIVDAGGSRVAAVESQIDNDAILSDAGPIERRLSEIANGLLPAYAPSFSESFSEWLDSYRARVTSTLCATLMREFGIARDEGNWSRAEGLARLCLCVEPAHEGATIGVARMLTLQGAAPSAMRLLDGYLADGNTLPEDFRRPVINLRRRIAEEAQHWNGDSELPFVGRAREMSLLSAAVESARDGRSTCTVLFGDAGIGKSRVAREIARASCLQAVHVERLCAQPHDELRPLGGFVQLIPRLCGAPGALGCAPATITELGRLTSHMPTPQLAIMKEPSGDVASLVTAIEDLIDAVCGERTLLLVIEDAHWMDQTSLRVLAELTGSRATRRLAVVVTTRDPTRLASSLRHVDRAAFIPVPPLEPAAAHTLAKEAFRQHGWVDNEEFLSWAAQASLGSPLLLLALVSDCQIGTPPFQSTPTLTELIRKRLRALTAKAAAAFQTCVLLGRNSTVGMLMTCLDLEHVDLLAAISELEQVSLVRCEYDLVTPSHALVADVCVRETSELIKKVIHRRIGGELSKRLADPNRQELVWDIAEHWLAAGDSRAAAEAFRTCAARALSLGTPREAIQMLLVACDRVRAPDRRGLAADALAIAEATTDIELVLKAASVVDEQESDLREDPLLSSASRLDASVLFEPLLRRVKAAHLDSEERLRIALPLLINADHECQPDLGHQLFDVITKNGRGTGSSDLWDRFEIVYHSSFGDLDRAEEVAHRLARDCNALAAEAAYWRYSNAATAYWRVGRSQLAVQTHELAFQYAQSMRAVRACCKVAMGLYAMYIDTGDTQRFSHWYAIVEKLRPSLGREMRRGWAFAIDADVATGLKDFDKLERAIEGMSKEAIGEATAGSERWLAAARIHLLIGRGNAPDFEKTLLELTKTHRVASENDGLSDYEIGAVVGCATENSAPRARDLLADYLARYRRSRAPLSRSLQNAATFVQSLGSPGLLAVARAEKSPNTAGATATATTA